MDRILDEDRKNNKNDQTKSKNKTKRGLKKNKVKQLNIFSSNAAQLEGKLQSFKNELENTNAAVFTPQETHYAKKGKFKVEDFEIFEAIRKKAKGGSAIGVHRGLQPFLIQKYSE